MMVEIIQDSTLGMLHGFSSRQLKTTAKYLRRVSSSLIRHSSATLEMMIKELIREKHQVEHLAFLS
jgi:hypothetical protein